MEIPWPKEVLLHLGNCQLQMEGVPALQTESEGRFPGSLSALLLLQSWKTVANSVVASNMALGLCWEPAGMGNGERHRLDGLPP